MGATPGTQNLGSAHSLTEIALFRHHIATVGLKETGPTAARVILGLRAKEALSTTSAMVVTPRPVIDKLPRKRPFSAFFPANCILIRGKPLPPLLIGECHLGFGISTQKKSLSSNNPDPLISI